ncbi:MAG: hypothetical protein JNK47_14160 [Mesorhizobium sp.]|nr:hypothetical protein [Mesorhizobium sp.]MBL8578364.1 hypothetical protein [Mesorhizobium sp.]
MRLEAAKLGLVALTAWSTPSHAESAITMREWCREVVLTIDDPDATASSVEEGFCLGSFITLRNATMLDALPRVCAPATATTGDFMRAYVRMVDSIQSLPASVAENWFTTAVVILQHEYPCSQ